jgi:poly(A) polymerase
MRAVAEPRVIPRAEHTISRRDIDPDALKVLYRLRQHEHVAYLVGGSVRDLLLGRRPKDFDIGTSAHPYQVKKLFRNCWIIGRRFRLAHIRFGQKVVEVATFRRQLQPGEEVVQDGVPAPESAPAEEATAAHPGQHAQPAHHDNTFGTPEEDAFRRDFTINALFYDIATFSIIDYVNGLDDLRAGIVRSIGDPDVRFVEDPVRMLRAVAFSARLDFTIEPAILDSIRRHRHEIARSSPARLLEEYYKILRSGYAEKTFRQLAALGLLEPISHELHKGADDPLWRMLAALDAYRRTHQAIPETLTNAVLLGTLIVPLGFTAHVPRHDDGSHATGVRLGDLPLARRDIERLRQMLGMQRRLQDLSAHSRVRHGLMHRSVFAESLTWMEIHGNAPEAVVTWKALAAEPAGPGDDAQPGEPSPSAPGATPRRRRRRRRRGFRPAPG